MGEREFLDLSSVSPIDKSMNSKLDEKSFLMNKYEVRLIFAPDRNQLGNNIEIKGNQ